MIVLEIVAQILSVAVGAVLLWILLAIAAVLFRLLLGAKKYKNREVFPPSGMMGLYRTALPEDFPQQDGFLSYQFGADMGTDDPAVLGKTIVEELCRGRQVLTVVSEDSAEGESKLLTTGFPSALCWDDVGCLTCYLFPSGVPATEEGSGFSLCLEYADDEVSPLNLYFNPAAEDFSAILAVAERACAQKEIPLGIKSVL